MAKAKEVDNVKTSKSQEYIQDSSSESGSDSATSETEKIQSLKDKIQSPAQQDDQTESSEASGSESSSTSSVSRSPTPTKRKAGSSQKDLQPTKKKSKTIQRGSSSSKKKRVAPPSGYSTVKADASDYVSDAGSMFADLDSKQVWHITAPASIPITSVRTLDIQAALRGQPILQHNGLQYSMFATAPRGEALLLPDGVENDYAGNNIDVARSFHLRETVDKQAFSKSTSSSESGTKVEEPEGDTKTAHGQFFASAEGTKKPHRQQPAGLLMRYQPYGSAAAGKGPYRLPDPASDADKENDVTLSNGLQMPSDIDETPISTAKTPKKSKKGEDSKHGKKTRKHDNAEKEAIDVDMSQSDAIPKDPRSKSKSKSKSDPEKKRKKQPKAEA